jgi:hypothetical protein
MTTQSRQLWVALVALAPSRGGGAWDSLFLKDIFRTPHRHFS